METIMCVVLSILLFICFAVGYKEGLRLGMRSAKGIEPKPIKGPVNLIKDTIKEREKQRKISELDKIYDEFDKFDGYTEQEREWLRGGARR